MIEPTFEIENRYNIKGKKILSLDEAGRGPVAGPLVCAGVHFSGNQNELRSKLIRDSKTLSQRQRIAAYNLMNKGGIRFAYVIIDNKFIDRFGLSASLKKGFESVIKKLKADIILMDGNCTWGIKNIMTIIKGDEKCKTIAAASIIAKVTRDRYMCEKQKDIRYKNYSFDRHKGYGTKKHYEEIAQHGYSALHRKTFLKNI